MAKKTSPLLPATDELIKKLGNRLRLARLRRMLTAKQVAERSGMSPMTLRNVESGESGVTIGAYIAVMQVLGIEKDFNYLAQKDELGRELQDSRLPFQSSSTKAGSILRQGSLKTQKSIAASSLMQTTHIERSAKKVLSNKKDQKHTLIETKNWSSDGGFKTSSQLANLIDFFSTPEKKHK